MAKCKALTGSAVKGLMLQKLPIPVNYLAFIRGRYLLETRRLLEV